MAEKQRLIDANAVAQEVRKNNRENFTRRDWTSKNVCTLLEYAPTVDAVEVVRCKDCKYYDNSEGIQWCILNSKFSQCGTDWHSFPEDGFCSYGERRSDEH